MSLSVAGTQVHLIDGPVTQVERWPNVHQPLTESITKQLVQLLVISHLDYCNNK